MALPDKNSLPFRQLDPLKPRIEPPHRPKVEKLQKDLVKDSWLEGGEASMYDVKRYFRNPQVRSDLRRKLKIPQNDTTQLNKHIEDMMKMIPNRFRTGVIEESEVKGSEFQRRKYWGAKRDIKEKSMEGFTRQELIDIARRKAKIKYIEEKFGK